MTHTPLTKAEREELRRLHDYASGRFTMRINGENDCRVELANGPSDDERGLHARFRYATGAHAFVAIHNHLPRLLADLDAAEAERDASRFHLAALASAASSIDPSDHCYVADIEAFRAAIASSQAYSNGDEIDKIAGSELRAVMESVDKWLSGDDLTANPATRAARAREVALKAIDAAEAERDEAVAEHTQRAVDQQNATAHGASWWPEKAIELRARAEKAEAQRDRAESERDALKDELHAHLAARNALRAEEGAES